MTDKEIVFENEYMTVSSDDETSITYEYGYMNMEDLATLLFYETQFNNFSWDNAPEGTVAWTMDSGGYSHWWTSDDLETNLRFNDWQLNSMSNKECSRSKAPCFGFDQANWQLSLRKRNFKNKFKIKIEVEKIE